MIKLLFKLFRKRFTELALSEINKPKEFAGMSIQFTDSNGRKYYRYDDELNMPIERKAHLEQVGAQLEYMISSNELDKFISSMETLIHQSVYEKKVDAIAKLSTLIEEMKHRKQILINRDIYYELLSAIYIREDETPAEIDHAIHEEKAKQFEIEAKKKSYSWTFFDSVGFGEYISYFKKLRDSWDTEMKRSNRMLKESNEIMEWLSSGRNLPSSGGNGKKRKSPSPEKQGRRSKK